MGKIPTQKSNKTEETDPLQCKKCDFRSLTLTGLNAHQRKHKNEAKNASKHVPGYKLRDPKVAFARHQERKHTKVFGHDCMFTPCMNFTLDDKGNPVLKEHIAKADAVALAEGRDPNTIVEDDSKALLLPEEVTALEQIAEAINMTERVVYLTITYWDWDIRRFPTFHSTGWKIDPNRNLLVIGRGVPRTEIPLSNVRFYDVEEEN